MKVYVAGPMSGLPNLNFPVFDAVAEHLRSHGYEVVSPAELDDPEFRARVLAPGVTGNETDLLGAWGDSLARDVKLIADSGIDGIILLYDWQKSRGAKLEAFIGLLCGLKFALYDPKQLGLLQPVSTYYVQDNIHTYMLGALRK